MRNVKISLLRIYLGRVCFVFKGKEGNDLAHKIIEKKNQLKPDYGGVPHVIVNDQYPDDKGNNGAAQTELVKLVCRNFEVKPLKQHSSILRFNNTSISSSI
jgi:hypothetical protein